MDIMLDLETMGTDPYSPVVAIGAVLFDARDILTTHRLPDGSNWFYQKITLESAMEAGLRPSASTIEWWLTNPGVTQQARDETFAGDDRTTLVLALDAFTDWHNSGIHTIWGNGARFDDGLLADCYRVLKKPAPWQHWEEGCYKTMKNLPAVRHLQIERCGTHHKALDDALSQARHLCQIVEYLGAYTPALQPTQESN